MSIETKNNISKKLKLCLYEIIKNPYEIQNPMYKLLHDFSDLSSILNIEDNKDIYLKYLKFICFNANNISFKPKDKIEIKLSKYENNLFFRLFYLNLILLDNSKLINDEIIIYLINKMKNSMFSKIKNIELNYIIKSKFIIDLIKYYMKNYDHEIIDSEVFDYEINDNEVIDNLINDNEIFAPKLYKKEKEIMFYNKIHFNIEKRKKKNIHFMKNYSNLEKREKKYNNSFKIRSTLEKIEKENIEFIKSHLDIFKEYNLNLSFEDIIEYRIDEIYKMIIISLIKNDQLPNINAYYTFDELDLEIIDISYKEYIQIINLLKENEIYFKNYSINNINDFFDENKIEFYYILFKYILKRSIFVYQIPFLLKTKKNIIEIIKSKIENIINFPSENNNIDRIEYVIEMISDSKYYSMKFLNKFKIRELYEILIYYKDYLFESKEEDIKIIEEIIKNEDMISDNDDYIKDFDFAYKMNIKTPIIKYLIESNGVEKSEKELNNFIIKWEELESYIKSRSYYNINKKDILILAKYFNDKNNEKLLLEIFRVDQYDNFIKFLKKDENDYMKKIKFYINIYKDYIFKKRVKNNNDSNKSIIKNSKNYSINNSNLKNENTNIIEESCYIINTSSFKESSNIKTLNDNSDNNEFNISYQILEFIKIIENNKNGVQFIKEMDNYFIIGTKNKLILYDANYSKITEKKFGSIILSINENSNNVIYICFNDVISSVEIFPKFKYHSEHELKDCFKILNLDKNKNIILNKNGVYETNIDFLTQFYKNLILNIMCKNAIVINKSYIAFISNKIVQGGEDELIIYNQLFKRITEEIKGYSFILSTNGLSVIPRNEKETNYKILLCACKKYLKDQKNGILLINFELEYYEKTSNYFYDTGNFEVYCFCPILFIQDSEYILVTEKNIYDTEYFLVGGFNKEKQKGIIKLYKIIYKENILETQIEYIQDIDFDYNNNFKGFKGPITDIIQSKNDGNILVSCMDGNVYLFSPPNIDYFIFYDSQNI